MFQFFENLSRSFLENYGAVGLFSFSFCESIFWPIPPDIFLAASQIFQFSKITAFIAVLAGSIFGATVAFFLGAKFGHRVAEKIFKKSQLLKIEKFLQKWEFLGVFIVSFTPLPFKVACWGAGIFELEFRRFLIAAILGRAARFFLVIFFAGMIF